MSNNEQVHVLPTAGFCFIWNRSLALARCVVIVAAFFGGVSMIHAEGTDDTLDTDWLGYVSRAPGVPTNSAFAGFENNESVSLYNGNLTIQHPSSPSFPLDGGGSIGLTRVYNSKNVRVDQVHVRDDPEWGYVYADLPHGQSWAGRGWTMHLGRIFRRPIHNVASPPHGAYSAYELYFQDATGTEHKLRAAGVPFGDTQQVAAHPILRHVHHPEAWGVEKVCAPPEFGFCGDACCDYGSCPPLQRPPWDPDLPGVHPQVYWS